MTLPISILNVYLLPLLLVGFLPILLHWLDRRRARVVNWPAVRFLIPRDKSRVRRLQRLEALLIATRSLLALSIAAAMLCPFLLQERNELETVKTSRAIGIVIDNSYSMALRQSEDGPTCLERAKDAALTLLDDAAPGSRAIVLGRGGAAGAARSIPTEPSSLGDLESARRAVRDVHLDGAPFDLIQAIDDACDSPFEHEASPRELYVLTDLQKNAASRAEPERLRFVRDRMMTSGPVRVVILDCGVQKPSNRFVAELAQEPLAAGLDAPVELSGTLESSGAPFPPDGLGARLIEENGIVEALEAKPGPDGRSVVRVAHRLTAALEALITLEAPADLLHEDDSRRIVVEALDRLPVLIVGDDGAGSGAGASRFVDLALAPRSGELSSPPLIFRPRIAKEITADGLESARVVILAGYSRLGDIEAPQLDAFVRRGGGLLVFAGSDVNAMEINAKLFRGGRGVLPASLSPRLNQRSPINGSSDALHPRDIATTHPALSIFKGLEEGDLSRITIRSWARVLETTPDSVILANVEAGSPWIIEKKLARGRTVLVTTSASEDDSDLPRTPLFLPLLHRLTRYLAARDPAERTLRVGEPIRWELPRSFATGKVSVMDPSGNRGEAEVSLDEGRRVALWRQTYGPGFYELSLEGPDGAVVAHFALNIPPEESRVERMDLVELSKIEQGLGVETVVDLHQMTRAITKKTARLELWPELIALALLCFFVEQVLSRIFSRGRVASRPQGWA